MVANRKRGSDEVLDLTTLMAYIELPFLRFKNHSHRNTRTRIPPASRVDGELLGGLSLGQRIEPAWDTLKQPTRNRIPVVEH